MDMKSWREIYADDLAIEFQSIKCEGEYKDGERHTLDIKVFPGTGYAIRWDDTVNLWQVIYVPTSTLHGLLDTVEKCRFFIISLSHVNVNHTIGESPLSNPDEHLYMSSIAVELGVRQYKHSQSGAVRLIQ